MSRGRWVSVAREAPISSVPPDKEVMPEIVLGDGASAPDSVEVRRTYETVFARFLRVVTRSSTRHMTDLMKVNESSRTARYEAWPAARLEPYQRPTQFVHCGPDGDRKPSSPLIVTPSVDLQWRRPPFRMSFSDPTGSVPVEAGIELPLPAEKTLTTVVEAPQDPDVELFVISPSASEGPVSFEQYVGSSLSCLERDLLGNSEIDQDAEMLRSMFEAAYEPFLLGDGRISAEIENPHRTVLPGEPQEFEVTLHPEREGSMMLAIGARVIGAEEEHVSVSEMLPLVWRAEDQDWAIERGAREPVKVDVPHSAALHERAVGA